MSSNYSVLTASLTTLDNNLKLDCRHLNPHVEELLQFGASGVLLLGTTGEANSLSVSERKHGLESILHMGIAPSELLDGTGCCAPTDTLDLAKHALIKYQFCLHFITKMFPRWSFWRV